MSVKFDDRELSLAAAAPASGAGQRDFVRELDDGRHDPALGRGAGVIIGGCELAGASGAFLKGLLAVALEYQLRCAADVDLRYHAVRVYGRRR
jgi:hypothetical protein